MDPLVRRRVLLAGGAVLLLGAVPSAYMRVAAKSFPPDTTPEGAYARIGLAVGEARVADMFAYLETEAQWAVFTILEYEKKAYPLVAANYPEPDRSRILGEYEVAHDAKDGPDFFAALAQKRGFVARLRRDLSGVARVEIQGERATIETARGTRYSFRRRENGIWGLTLFTADLKSDAERAARDYALIERAAADYAAGK